MQTFLHQVRVPYADTDKAGVVYYANYLVYFEMARGEMMREIGLPYSDLEKQGVIMPVVEAHCRYLRSALFDDLLTVATRCTEIKRAKVRIEYEVKRDADTLARGYTVHVCVSPEGKVLRPPKVLQQLQESNS